MRNSHIRQKCHGNDLDPKISADIQGDDLEFLKTIQTGRADKVQIDPP